MKYEHFELAEFISSETAKAKHIDNTPTFEIVDHLNELVTTILEPIRTAWNSGIRVSSGYRCWAVNKLLSGASDTSVHPLGYAVDIVPINGKFKEFTEFVASYLKENDIPFDQLLIEKNSRGSQWLHIGLKNNRGEQRRQIKSMTVK